MEEGITSQLIDQGAELHQLPLTVALAARADKNDFMKKQQRTQTDTQRDSFHAHKHIDTMQHLVPECKRPFPVKRRDIIIQVKLDRHKHTDSKQDEQDQVKMSFSPLFLNVLVIISLWAAPISISNKAGSMITCCA